MMKTSAEIVVLRKNNSWNRYAPQRSEHLRHPLRNPTLLTPIITALITRLCDWFLTIKFVCDTPLSKREAFAQRAMDLKLILTLCYNTLLTNYTVETYFKTLDTNPHCQSLYYLIWMKPVVKTAEQVAIFFLHSDRKRQERN
jgi:hypothetical protein